MAASYQAKCPHCGHLNLVWGSEWRDRKLERTNKCVHYDGLTKTGALRFFKGLPIVKDAAQWFRCVYAFRFASDKPDYRFEEHSCAVESWLDEASRFHECVDTSDIEATVLAVKAPPADWLVAKRTSVIAHAAALGERADFLRAELAKHYPGHTP